MVKKKMISWLLCSIVILPFFAPMAQAESDIVEMKDLQVIVNGEQVSFSFPPIMKNDRILVPLRDIFEAMGASVYWDEKNKAITAVKNKTFVHLTIHSDVAKVENEEILLDTPVVLYKGYTFVPLRFVSEAFEGEIEWNEERKTVAIDIAPTIFIPVDTPIYLNNKPLDLGTYHPVVWNGITFLPIETVLENLPYDVYWEKKEDVYEVIVNGVELQFIIGENYAIENEERLEWYEPIMEYEGTVWIPTTAIAKVFGGYSHYEAETKEIYLYVESIKFAHEFLTKETYTFPKPTNVTNTTVLGNRRLMVSDNPENLNERTIQEDNITLWQDEVYADEEKWDHRVFGWHQNNLGQDVKIGITIENLSYMNEIEVVGLNGTNQQSANSWVNYDVGLPIAERILSGMGTPVKLDPAIVKHKETILLKSFDVADNNTIGFLYDFTVRKKSGTGKLKYKIRTVLSKNGEDLTTILEDPVAVDPMAKHPRGIWSSSELVTELPPYEVGSAEVAHQISNGVTDNLFSVSKGIGGDADMLNNVGHYGASYKVKIPIVNKTGKEKTIRVRLGARGGIYNGAVKVNGTVFLVPTLKPMTEVANVVDYVVDKENDTLELEIMHAGGASLPLTIDIITVE